MDKLPAMKRGGHHRWTRSPKSIGSISEIERALVFLIRLYPLLQLPSSGEAWFRHALDAKAGYREQAAAQDAIAGEAVTTTTTSIFMPSSSVDTVRR
ncbi:hypothetical protein L2449_12440 [Mesorhizobium muleiense]|uniref:hypothetical protein n=1 Tax=Mesorhizobium muleiense TaxID=1004279 RepID=UPI001F341E23|nr:hypothetical protein [Mesorhizobium muleiense]MCF6117686.1 hypothetical protein [Mesorhizobium muleiense]